MRRRRHPVHRNPNGNWCYCPWGPYAADPYVSPDDQEVVGSVHTATVHEAMIHEAAKIDWLRGREDLQTPEATRFLDQLHHAFLRTATLRSIFDETGHYWPDYVETQIMQSRSKLNQAGKSPEEIEQILDNQRTKLEQQMDQVGGKPPKGLAEYLNMDPNELKDRMAVGSNRDKLLPWLVREWQQGRVLPENFIPRGNWQNDYPMTYLNDEGEREGLEGLDLDTMGRWMNHQSQTGNQGVDIMQHHIGQALREANKFEGAGELVHEYPEDHPSYPGLGIYKLNNRRDLRVEGRRMQHCIGHSSQRYDKKLADGEALYYSVREPGNGQPLGTIELVKKQSHYFKCPECGRFTPGTPNEGDYYQTRLTCPNDGTLLGNIDRGDSYDPVPAVLPGHDAMGEDAERVQMFPTNLKHVADKPSAEVSRIAQFYGKGDGPVPPHGEQAMNDFLGQFGHDYFRTQSMGGYQEDEEEEPEPEPQSLEDMGFDYTYYHDAPTTPQEYIDHYRSGTFADRAAPEEYHRAVRAAGDHGFEYPDLMMSEEPDMDQILNSMAPNSLDEVDPQQIDQVFRLADEHGHWNHLQEAAQRWLEQDYQRYLDPYGQSGGRGNFYQPRMRMQFPVTENGNAYGPDNPYTHMPEYHYPENGFQHEDLFARNLQYQLQQRTDPQTGEINNNENAYPYQSLQNDRARYMPAPRYPRQPDDVPIPEQTGPAVVPAQNRFQIELPFGREDRTFTAPDRDQMDFDDETHQRRRELEEQGYAPEDAHYQFEDPGAAPGYRPRYPIDEDEPFERREFTDQPHRPRDLFDPNLNIERPFPGMEWQDPNLAYPTRAWDPTNVQQYSPGQQQGELYPTIWYEHAPGNYNTEGGFTELYPGTQAQNDYYYHNTRNNRAGVTQLPPYLFPDHYNVMPRVNQEGLGQLNMWDHSPGTIYRSEPGIGDNGPANINTHHEQPMPAGPGHQVPYDEYYRQEQEWGQRPYGEWRANYHPRQDDEWVDEDEPHFSATIPEPRWKADDA